MKRADTKVAIIEGVVQMYDTDASGRIFYGAATRWCTDALSALMSLIGLSPEAQGGVASVVRAASFSYESSMRRGDRFTHRAWVSRVGTTSFDVSHEITVRDMMAVSAGITHVSVDLETGRTLPVSDLIRSALPQATPAERTPT